jgi:hypothetical protein
MTEWNSLLEELLALQPNEDGTPVDLAMTDEAKAAWVSYYNAHAQREVEEHGPRLTAAERHRSRSLQRNVSPNW